MESTNLKPLTKPQAKVVRERIADGWKYLVKLKARLREIGYRGTLLYREVEAAENAVHGLAGLLETMADGPLDDRARQRAARPPERLGHCFAWPTLNPWTARIA